jgi:hypothetical protein
MRSTRGVIVRAAFGVAAALVIAGCGSTFSVATPTPAGATGGGASAAPTVVLQTAAPTAKPTAAPTARPTPRPTARPTPRPTPRPANLCGAPPNPWNYNFCGGGLIYAVPSSFCDYFDCIPSFWESTSGYAEQCVDGTYSHSGGRSGACSYHDGERRPLYS